MTTQSHHNGITNAAAQRQRWQPRAEWRDDLPLLDPRLGHPDIAASEPTSGDSADSPIVDIGGAVR